MISFKRLVCGFVDYAFWSGLLVLLAGVLGLVSLVLSLWVFVACVELGLA